MFFKERLNNELAQKLIELAVITGKSMQRSLSENGVDIDLINYQINGNWSVKNLDRDPLHMHLYGRSKLSKFQKYGESLYLPLPDTGFYDKFKGLNDYDIDKMARYIQEFISFKSKWI